MFEDRHLCLGDDATDQTFAPTRDRQVDLLGQGKEVADGRTVGRLDQLDRVAGKSARSEGVDQDAGQREVRPVGFLAAPQDHRVAALDAEGRGVDRDVRAALEDHEDDAERDAHLGDLEAVGRDST